MRFSFKHMPRVLASSAFAVFVCSGVHASPVPGEASASLNELSWELIDLAPDDGITPWIKVSEGRAYFNYGAGHVEANPLPTSDSINFNGTNEELIGPDRLRATARHVGPYRYPSDFRFDMATPTNLEHAGIFFDRDQLAMDYAGLQFTLSPHTKLVIHGKAQLSSHAMADFGVQAEDLSPLAQPYVHTVSSDASIFAALQAMNMSSRDTWEFSTHAVSEFSNGLGSGLRSDLLNKDFYLSLSSGEVQLEGAMDLRIDASVAATVVPEPGTWLLSSLGLAAMSLALRRRQSRV